jgi:hypothetical protein
VRPGEIGDAPVPAGKVCQDLAPGGIGQSGEGAIQLTRRIFNHLVKY